jgi:hypothetical protein
MHHRTALLALALLACPSSGAAQQLYHLTRLDPPNAGLMTQASAINSAGDVSVWTGPGTDVGETWVLGAGPPRFLAPLPGEPAALPTRLFDAGRALGVCGSTRFQGRPLVWSPAGVPHELRSPSSGTTCIPLDANGAGWIVGISSTQLALLDVPVAWISGVLVPLDLPPGVDHGVAAAINARGTIVGYAWPAGVHTYRSWVREGLGPPRAIQNYPGHPENRLHDVNSSGLAVGESFPTQFSAVGLFYDCNDDSSSIVTPPADHGGMSLVAVNRSGLAVGNLAVASVVYALVADRTQAFALDEWLDDSGQGWSLPFAVGINDAGWIACTGIDPQGKTTACVLTPVSSNSVAVPRKRSTASRVLTPEQHRTIREASGRLFGSPGNFPPVRESGRNSGREFGGG